MKRVRKAAQVAAFGLGLCLSATASAAETWSSLTGAEVRAALSERTVDYPGAWQRFEASGRTLYNAGQDSWGTWDISGDQYCSRWPPSTDWACYDVEHRSDGGAVRFIGFGETTIGVFRN